MPKDAQPKRLLRVKEAAANTGLSAKRIRRAIRNGELRFIKFEEFGSWWIDVEDLNQWIEKQKQTA